MTKTTEYAFYGATMRCTRNSWSAIGRDGIPVLTVWDINFDWPNLRYHRKPVPADLPYYRHSRQFKDYIEHVKHAIEHCDGHFYGVYNKRTTPEGVRPWHGTNFQALKMWIFKVVSFDETTGEFEADIIYNSEYPPER